MSTLPDNPLLAAPRLQRWRWRDYLELTKPKVSLLIVFTAIVGMVLASPAMVPLPALIFGTLGIALASGSAAAFNHVLELPHGIILVTGPTGSGKTSTLYTALAAINDDIRKIITIEDPIEYQMRGINQIQVSEKA